MTLTVLSIKRLNHQIYIVIISLLSLGQWKTSKYIRHDQKEAFMKLLSWNILLFFSYFVFIKIKLSSDISNLEIHCWNSADGLLF